MSAAFVALLTAQVALFAPDLQPFAGQFAHGARMAAYCLWLHAPPAPADIIPMPVDVLVRLIQPGEGAPRAVRAVVDAIILGGAGFREGIKRRSYTMFELGAAAAAVFILCRCTTLADSNRGCV